MLLYKLAPSPAALSGELHAGDGLLLGQYARHYRHLAQRAKRYRADSLALTTGPCERTRCFSAPGAIDRSLAAC